MGYIKEVEGMCPSATKICYGGSGLWSVLPCTHLISLIKVLYSMLEINTEKEGFMSYKDPEDALYGINPKFSGIYLTYFIFERFCKGIY